MRLAPILFGAAAVIAAWPGDAAFARSARGQACVNDCVRKEWICQQKNRLSSGKSNPICKTQLDQCIAPCPK